MSESWRIGPETERLILRAYTVDDAEAYFRLNSHPDVMRYTGESPIRSVEQAREAIKNYPDFDTVGFGRWCCVLKNQDLCIGFCGLKYLIDLDEVDVGYRFLPEYWGRGFATESCQASLDFGFDTLALNRIIGLALAENVASIRVLEKVGMQSEGEISYDGQQVELYGVSAAHRTRS